MTTNRLPPESQKCARCGASLIAPEWSENTGENEVTSIWHCGACGLEFETKSPSSGPKESELELVEEFLPNLLVE
ncbi:MAG TPA: hypothetical protein VJR71_05440 [Pseudolabrys sp.]|nr:hypothetical protein [Pseudolabrys sp.]